ncbi:MAG: ABC transporter permease [Saprospiraceae bacterium]|nr:ABC transporter permease [Saprospiraceae bacterium]MBK8450430.1 ABC transporter permease [Saprospiraceae bacterium]MBK8485486.1 ABC transporter permease [Saprospiraceae bacterium]MBK9222713.1 ABC transporter permease [Saprospiraceae bacterium]MBK9720242.1 ABC transporter permease [Saprospiraceae bacterium]
MNLKLIIDISKSLLLARFKQSLVAAIGVTFSITMFITLLGFMTGLNDLLDGLILNRTAHIRLFNEIKPNQNQAINLSPEFKSSYNFIQSIKARSSRREIYNSESIMQALNSDKRVLGIAPKISAPVFFNDGNIEITGVIQGIDVVQESKLFHFLDYVTEGHFEDIEFVTNSIILGKGLADKLLANLGDVVQLTTAQGERFSLKVVGFFQSGIAEYDKVQSYASIATTQKVLGKTKNYITDIQIKLHNVNEAIGLAKEYEKLFDTDAEDIQTANAQFETGSTVRSIISYAVGITLLIVAGFGIFNILNMMIFEKMESIAILKATGFSGKDVKNIFLYIALSIGFFGGIMGLLFGFLLSTGIDQIPFKTASLPTISTYPINYSIKYYLIGLVFSLITTYLAGYFPARKASMVDPVVIIRGK